MGYPIRRWQRKDAQIRVHLSEVPEFGIPNTDRKIHLETGAGISMTHIRAVTNTIHLARPSITVLLCGRNLLGDRRGFHGICSKKAALAPQQYNNARSCGCVAAIDDSVISARTIWSSGHTFDNSIFTCTCSTSAILNSLVTGLLKTEFLVGLPTPN